MSQTTALRLPKFWELAEARLPNSPKTVNIKISRATCQMMIDAERNGPAGLNPARLPASGGGAAMTHTKDQLNNWRRYEEVRQQGRFNMLDFRARQLTGLTREEYLHCLQNYGSLKRAALMPPRSKPRRCTICGRRSTRLIGQGVIRLCRRCDAESTRVLLGGSRG